MKDTYYIMATLGRDFRNMIYFDSLCVFLCVANAIMHFRRVWFFVNLWLNALQTAAGLLVGYALIYQTMFEGMTYFNMSMFGQESAKYRDFWNAHLFTYYAMEQT